MHTNSTTERIARSTRTRQTTHHKPFNKRGNRVRAHAAAEAQIAARFES